MCAGRVSRGKDLSVLMASRDSDRISLENFSDEGGSEIRLSSPNSLDHPRPIFTMNALSWKIYMRKEIDLAEVRALQNGACRRPMNDPWVRPPRKRTE
ncbi:hypothetical protein F511_34601 [Dorcoceras hygrometricum]|uniref:Uncharacterized protein n=1 Tax=Dorcoceras hygrometricum TaxID=472368 RepID=A0A2Z7CTX2_9LAMI|nr:hypothetical protein F511_34601 [Dorcoceras hygrometricum]